MEEKGGQNLYAFNRNRVGNKIDLLGLCTPGEITDITCNISIVPYSSNPDLENGVDVLFELIGDIQLLDEFVNAIQGQLALRMGLNEAVDWAVENILKETGDFDAKELARIGREAMNDLHGTWGGWDLYTRIEYKECECCTKFFFFKGTCWNDYYTEWEKYKNSEGKLANFSFETKLDAYSKACTVCDEHLKRFKKENYIKD
jgi:hypothetical protein